MDCIYRGLSHSRRPGTTTRTNNNAMYDVCVSRSLATSSASQVVDVRRLLERGTTSFLVDDILRPDFGVRRRETDCVSCDADTDASSSALMTYSCTSQSTTTTSTAASATLCDDVSQLSTSRMDAGSKSLNVDTVPAWIFSTRYSDRPSSGCKRGRRKRATGYKRRRARSDYNVDQLIVLTTEFNICQYLTEQRRASLGGEPFPLRVTGQGVVSESSS